MLEFSDAPYRFFEAKPSAPLIWLGRRLNRGLILPGANHRIREISVSGEMDELEESRRNGDRLLFVINHPSHSDPQVLTEVHRRLGVDSCFMAAYDVFLRNKFCAWSMQKMGNFSIDREGADRKAMAAAIKVLTDGERALNIFPEGNVYLTNDRLTPFLDGAAFIALKAQAATESAVKIVPLSLKFTHLTKPREAITERMLRLGAESGHRFPSGSTSDPLGAVLGLGRHILGGYLKKHGLHGKLPADDPSLYDLLENFAANLVAETENGLGIAVVEGAPLTARIAKARAKIHQLRSDPAAQPHPEIAGLADRAILALRIHGYLTPYLTEHPTIDRYAETVERIAEDFHSRTMPRTGPRRAMAMIGAPMDVREQLGAKSRDAIAALTKEMERRVQAGIDALNASNDAPGGRLVEG
ncbi:1-acyl-sn-glycerol-3-phosphate acyltransferase [Akkermansiaceae bacterium]|nr:1-acyl-sn-glycerol-3-phosphate acyltransferase [Akkermansiaceae bacterium]